MKKIFLIFLTLLFLFPNNNFFLNEKILIKAFFSDIRNSKMMEEEIINLSLKKKHQYFPNLLEQIEVDITAYINDPRFTDDTPDICAWGDNVRKGIVAVSRDLIEIGLERNKKILIVMENGNIYEKTILDKMNKRFEKRIDFFFYSLDKARNFGKKKGVIYFESDNGTENIV